MAAEPPPDLDPWLRRHLDRLTPHESDVAELVRGGLLLTVGSDGDSAGIRWGLDWDPLPGLEGKQVAVRSTATLELVPPHHCCRRAGGCRRHVQSELPGPA